MSNEFEIKVELYLDSPLKSEQKNTLMNEFSEIIRQNDGKIETQDSTYVEKRSLEIPLILYLVFGLGAGASILSIINSVFGIYKNLGSSKNNSEVFVKRKDGNYVKVDDGMNADELKKQLEK